MTLTLTLTLTLTTDPIPNPNPNPNPNHTLSQTQSEPHGRELPVELAAVQQARAGGGLPGPSLAPRCVGRTSRGQTWLGRRGAREGRGAVRCMTSQPVAY